MEEANLRSAEAAGATPQHLRADFSRSLKTAGRHCWVFLMGTLVNTLHIGNATAARAAKEAAYADGLPDSAAMLFAQVPEGLLPTATIRRMIASEHMAARNVICRFAISSNTRERRSRASRAATVQDRADEEEDERARQPLTPEDMGNQGVRPTRRACYKFVALSEAAFVIQVIAGIACSIGFVRPCGLSACCIPSFTVWRSLHLTFQIYYHHPLAPPLLQAQVQHEQAFQGCLQVVWWRLQERLAVPPSSPSEESREQQTHYLLEPRS